MVRTRNWLALLVAFVIKGVLKLFEFVLDRGFQLNLGFREAEDGRRRFGIDVKLNAFNEDGQVDVSEQDPPPQGATGYGRTSYGGGSTYYGGRR